MDNLTMFALLGPIALQDAARRAYAAKPVHAKDCQGSPVILTTSPPQDGGVVGCTCGADRLGSR